MGGVANIDGGWGVWHIFFEMVEDTTAFTNYGIAQPFEHENETMNYFFRSGLLHRRLNNCYKTWNYKKIKKKRNEHKEPIKRAQRWKEFVNS